MEEKKKILSLLEEGKINADEAVKLFQALRKSREHLHGELFKLHHHPHRMMKRFHMNHHGLGPGHKMIVIKTSEDCGCPEDFVARDLDCCQD